MVEIHERGQATQVRSNNETEDDTRFVTLDELTRAGRVSGQAGDLVDSDQACKTPNTLKHCAAALPRLASCCDTVAFVDLSVLFISFSFMASIIFHVLHSLSSHFWTSLSYPGCAVPNSERCRPFQETSSPCSASTLLSWASQGRSGCTRPENWHTKHRELPSTLWRHPRHPKSVCRFARRLDLVAFSEGGTRKCVALPTMHRVWALAIPDVWPCSVMTSTGSGLL